MNIICGIKFKKAGKIYYFELGDFQFVAGDKVIVETARGTEIGEVAIPRKEIEDLQGRELKPIIRKATKADITAHEENLKKAVKAMETCRQKIANHKLEMKLVDCEYTFDNSKIIFYFTADGRVDFRELVKDLASVFKTRIELRQIGVRDECKLKGGLGICGNPMCCATSMGEFHTVSIKMAKEQGLSLNPTKISGTCGRLMCCLKHEQAAYEELLKTTPKNGALVDTPNGRGVVVESNMLKGNLKIKMGREPDAPIKSFHKSEVKIIHDASIKVDKADIEALKGLEE